MSSDLSGNSCFTEKRVWWKGFLGFGVWGFGDWGCWFWGCRFLDQYIGFAGRVDKTRVTYLPRLDYPVASSDCWTMCPALATTAIDHGILGFRGSGIWILDPGSKMSKTGMETQSAIKKLTTQPQGHYLVGRGKKILEGWTLGLTESTFYESSVQPSWAAIN